jgi:multidrug efflux system membrane fusion protein
MTKRKLAWAAFAGAVVLVGAVVVRGLWSPSGAVAQSQPRGASGRIIPVEVAKAEKKSIPVNVESLGTVTPIASVALKSRLETVITKVHFEDGARVKQGDILFTLDGRQIEAQIQQIAAQLEKDKAQLEGAERDNRRFTDLFAKGAGTQVNLDNSKTQVETLRAAVKADDASLQNLQVQLSYCTIRAPIDGRMSAANVKVGNFVRPADTAPLATIIQIAPVYVSFTVPQRLLTDVRHALNAETATVEAVVPGSNDRASGQVTMIENSVDTTTGMVTVRATMPNKDSLLWPGTLVQTRLTLRSEEGITVPSTAVQVSQTGSFVYVVENDTAKVVAVKVNRVVGANSVIEKGLDGGETVVTDGQLLLSNGSKVAPRRPDAGA